MRHSLALANVLSWSTIVLLENASHFSIKDYKRTPKETVCKFIKLWGVLYDGSSNCSAILRYLSSPLFWSWIIIDSHLKNGLSCFRSSAKFNQMKGCVLRRKNQIHEWSKILMTTSYFFPDYPKLAIVLFRLELYASREKKNWIPKFWVKWYKEF